MHQARDREAGRGQNLHLQLEEGRADDREKREDVWTSPESPLGLGV